MDNKHGPPTPPDAVEHFADPTGSVILTSHPSYQGDIEVGEAYWFSIMGREILGTVLHTRKGFVTMRTKNSRYTVPVTDVTRPKKT